jgi:hypothetical protein
MSFLKGAPWNPAIIVLITGCNHADMRRKRMMRKSVSVLSMAALFFSVLSLIIESRAFSGIQSTTEIRRITKDQLKSLLDNQDTIIIDVRQEGDWRQSDRKIKGAVHEDPLKEEESWARKYPKGKNIVLYCA